MSWVSTPFFSSHSTTCFMTQSTTESEVCQYAIWHPDAIVPLMRATPSPTITNFQLKWNGVDSLFSLGSLRFYYKPHTVFVCLFDTRRAVKCSLTTTRQVVMQTLSTCLLPQWELRNGARQPRRKNIARIKQARTRAEQCKKKKEKEYVKPFGFKNQTSIVQRRNDFSRHSNDRGVVVSDLPVSQTTRTTNRICLYLRAGVKGEWQGTKLGYEVEQHTAKNAKSFWVD